MQISDTTIEVLKNFSTINGNIVIGPGNVVKTVSESKTILSRAELEDDFPVEVGIYDLNDFLNWLNLTRSRGADFDFGAESVTAKNDKGLRTVYEYADTSILTSPSKDLVMPESEITFRLSAEEIAEIQQASSVLGLSEVVAHPEDGKIRLTVSESDDSTDNNYSILIDGESTVDADDFSIVFNIKNLRMVKGDYDVALSSKLISQFTHTELNVKYWIALQKNSRFD